MHLLFTLLLGVAGQPTTLDSREMTACHKPAVDDLRPYTLCLAETWFDQTEVELGRQLNITLARVEAESGANAADRLRREQQEWVKSRDSECVVLAAPSPSTQVARNDLGCRAQRTEARIAQLKVLAGPQ
jgi:uncharacterized protein YecT (DUF1311 family)